MDVMEITDPVQYASGSLTPAASSLITHQLEVREQLKKNILKQLTEVSAKSLTPITSC